MLGRPGRAPPGRGSDRPRIRTGDRSMSGLSERPTIAPIASGPAPPAETGRGARPSRGRAAALALAAGLAVAAGHARAHRPPAGGGAPIRVGLARTLFPGAPVPLFGA